MREIIPYDYQLEQVDKIIKQVTKDRVTLAQLPTGGGKTVEFSLIINRYLQKFPDKSVLVLVHREELLQQAKETIESMYPDYGVDLIVAGIKYVKKVHIYIGMVESVNTRAQFMPLLNLGLVIFDEAHMGNFTKMHQIFQKEYLIGFTATPISASKKTPLVKYYKNIVVGPQIKELIDIKRLAQNITYCPEDVVNETMLEYDVKSGDFSTGQMSFVFSRPQYVMNTVIFYGQFCRGQKTIIFNVNVEHSKLVTACFNYCGFPCQHLDGETPFEQRRDVLKWFKETDNAVLCNVGIATMGFDEPTIKSVIVNLATLSLTKWIQMCGRGGRYVKGEVWDKKRKEYFSIIDMGGNHLRFGDWNEDRDWETLFYYPDLPGRPGLAPTKTCPKCFGLVHAAVIECKLPSLDPKAEEGDICGHIFDRKKHDKEVLMQQLIVVTKGIDVKKIMGENKHRKTYFPMYEMARNYVDAMHESGMEFSDMQIKGMYEEYYLKVMEWHKAAFENKPFKEAWHRYETKRYFYEYLKTKFQQDQLV